MSNTSTNDAQNAPPRRLKPWNKKLRGEFEDVPHDTTDESELYGPWDTAIHRLFQDGDGFQVAPHHMKKDYRGEPEWTIFYLIKVGSLPVCVFEIKPHRDLRRPQARITAYRQVEARLLTLLVDNHPVPKLYGVSIIGERFLILQMDTTTAKITPALNPQGSVAISDVAPAYYWRNQVLKRSGYRRLNEMVNNVKHMIKDFPMRVPDIALASESEADPSDTSEISFEDEADEA